MSELIRAALTGAIAGGIYSLIAVGLVVTYTVTGVFDLAYGGIAFVAALTFYELNSGLGWNRFLAAAVVVFVLAPVLGLLFDQLVYRPLATATDGVKLVTSVGLLVALPAAARFIVEKGNSLDHWGLPSPDNVPRAPGLIFQPVHSYKIANGIVINSNELAVIIAGLLVGLGLWLLFRSPFGLSVRAIRDRGDLAEIRGINKNRVGRLTAVLGSCLAAIAGVLGAPILSALDYRVYTLALFTAAAAVVFGRFRSVPLTYAGGILLGLLTNLTYRYVHVHSIPALNQAVPFVLLLAGLLVLGRNNVRLAGVSARAFSPPNWRADLSLGRRFGPSAAVLVVFLVLAEFVFADFWVSLVVRSLAFAVILLSITVIMGIGGMVSLAQATFSISSAFTIGLLVSKYGWPFLPAVLVGIAVAVALGVLVALPSLRLGGVPLTLATLALALMGQSLILGWSFLTNSSAGWLVDRPDIGPLHLGNDRTLLPVLAAIVLIITWVVCNVRSSPSGRAMLALRASEPAATSIGLSVVGARLRLVCLSAAIAGLGGALLLLADQGVSTDSVSALDGLTWLIVIVVLGVGRPLSAVVGGLSLVLFPALVSSGFTVPFNLFSWGGTDSALIPPILFGLAVIDLSRNQDGALERFSRWRYLRRHRQPASLEASAPLEPAAAPGPDQADVAACPDNAARPGVALSGVRVGYGTVEVVHSLSASFPVGKISVVLGANGAGKTTLLSAMAGVLPLSGGSISSTVAAGTRADGVAGGRREGVLVPEGRGVFPGLSVEDNLRVCLRNDRLVRVVYEGFPSLAARRKVLAGSLSGGEQQMLALAPMLVAPPALLLIDEPTLGLAPQVTRDVLRMIRECRDAGTTVILADEKQTINAAAGEHTVLLALGRALWEGPSDQIPETAIAAAYGMGDGTEHGGRREKLDEQLASMLASAPG